MQEPSKRRFLTSARGTKSFAHGATQKIAKIAAYLSEDWRDEGASFGVAGGFMKSKDVQIEEQDVLEGQALEPDGYIQKPIEPVRRLEALQRLERLHCVVSD
jgi:hypothetical protein